jgi:glycosyltransferase involved in cell wall biosynthesis
MTRRRRVLIVQPSLQPPGGGNAPAAWMIQALKDDHDVSVLTWHPVDLDPINAYYGTSIAPGEITALEVPPAVRRPIDLLPTDTVLLKIAFVVRHTKRLIRDTPYDVVISGSNETDFGAHSIQYVHYPRHLRPRPAVDLRWFHAWAPLLRGYYAACDRVMAFSPQRVPEAITLANSKWTADLVARLYGLEAAPRVVHPPVAGAADAREWTTREDGFVCVGRIAPEKEVERVIAIVEQVRDRLPAAHLHIIGSPGRRSYYRSIERLALARRDWVTIHPDVSRRQLLDLLAAHRYALHGMREEHFGIGPAEAVASGCIAFVPDGGGQMEIVGRESQLMYRTVPDAVDKIVAVMESATRQAELRGRLEETCDAYSAARFVETIRSVVGQVAAS